MHQPENSWMRITSNTSIGDLQPGENTTFDIHVNSFNVDLGTYFDSVDITSDNYNDVQVNLTAFVTDLQNGSLLFHVTDALERNLSNASVSLINKETYDEFDGITNSSGYALLENLPVGRYIFEVSSDGTNTLPQMGTVKVEAMEIPELIEISLYMSFIDFDWEVTPTSIEDYYNVILKMRFETDVPIPLLLAFPPSIDYNMVPGEEKTGSFKVYNVGLVSIYNVSISPINYNGIILDPLVTNVDEIKGKSNIEVPYKIRLSSSAANCQLLSGKINIQGRYVHFINNREVISYARTSIPVTVKTPVDGSCIPDWPDIPFCFNFDGLHFGTQTENLSVDPNIIWLKTGLGWGDLIDDKNYTREDVAIATNHNEIGSIRLTDAIGITFSIGVNEIVSYFTMGTLTPQIPLGIDLVTDGLGVDIPFFDKFWFGDFTPNVIVPDQSSTMDLKSLNTGVGVPLPALIGGGLLFEYGNLDDFSCFWLIPIGGYDLTLPTFGLPDINIHFPHVYLPGGSIGGGTFIWNSVPNVFIPPSHPHFRGTTYVPWNWPDWNWPDFSIDQVHRKPRPRVTETIHEVIELSISQNVTMERDAFWAGLGIFNKMPDKNIDNVGVTLHIRDDTGSANDKFFIKSPNLININDVDGSGVISPLSLSTAQWLIIPKPGAGGINPEGAKYNISANITYSVDGINFETVTYEIEIVVKPQPEMVLDYFIPSDVIANKPFKLAVKVTNDGFWEARDFAIETAQPVIYYNPSGLLLDFEIIRSQLDGEERSTSMKVDFGDIQPGESKIAWWDMVTSIDGTFTEFTGEFTHSSELGGMETSLIKDIHTYIIQKELGTGEMGYDFLANSESDENYYILFNSSTGSSTFVNNANYAVVNMPTPENPVLDVSIEDYTGDWVIVSIEDPYNNAVPIEKVIRTSDGTEIPSYNYWMRDGRILIVDHYTEGFDGNYTIIFKYSNVVPVITTDRTMFDGRIVVEENKAINFSGSDSYDEFGSIVSYKWEFGDGSPIELGENISHRYSQMGEYGVILNVTNNAGVSSQTSVKVLVVKQIVEGLVLLSDFSDKLWNLQMATIYENERKVTNYYLDVSYQSNYINFTTYPSIIHINKKISDYNKNPIQYYIINDTLNKLPNKYVNQDFILVVATDYGEREMAFPCITDNEPYCNYPYSIAVVKSDSSDIYYRTWSHEIGHTLGRKLISSKRYNDYDLLWDLYNGGPIKMLNGKQILNDGRVSGEWDIMGGKPDSTPPPHLSSMSKVLLGWMKTKEVSLYDTVNVRAIEQGNYGDQAFIYRSVLYNNIQYVIEARDNPRNEVVIYKLEDYDLMNDAATPRNNLNTVSINNIGHLDLGWNFVWFYVSEESENPYSAKVKIAHPSLYDNMVGWVVSTTIPISNNIQSWWALNESNLTEPDIDLHAYSLDGKHIGVNYSNNLYENEIQGTFSSGDLINGEEWIFVPSDINVSYYIGSHDVQKFLEENPDFNSSNATIEFEATYMEYSPNTKPVQLPDGNWTISNRSVSDTQVENINPGEMKEIILKDKIPPNIITELTTINGTTWINWTWANPYNPDFNHTEVNLNGRFITNIPVPQNYYNATGLLPDTSYELSTRTVDAAGNINETWVNSTARTLSVSDNTPPTITFISPTDPSGTTLTTRNWTFINVSLSEPGLTWLEWNGINESMSGSGTKWYINKTYLANGVYTYRVWANDSSMNENVSDTRTIEIDYVTENIQPIITITSPINDTLYTMESVDLNYTISEPTVWEGYSLDGADNITLFGNTTLFGLNDGSHNLTVYANDTYGNMNSSTVCFTIDTIPPAGISDLQHTAGQTWINWTWTDPDNPDFSHTMVYLDAIFKANTSNASCNATGLDAGTEHTISTRTVDSNGNVNDTWVNDTAPTKTISTIEFTYVPPLGSIENLRGKVTNVTPSDYKVAVNIYVSGWWTKPTFADPLTTIQSDGNWTCDITTGGSDQNATKIKAYLIPNSYTPPLMSGEQTLPSELDQNASASIEAIRKPERIIQFSGYNWTVKSGEILMGPGPNYFSDSDENVWVDQQDQLHLKIVNRDGKWYCAEVYSTESFGYGKYIFYVASRVDQLDKNVVAGLFTWDTAAPEYNYREIDIEFSKWGQEINDNAQYVVQPWDQPENMETVTIRVGEF